MIDHPIRTIKEAGITDIMVVTGTEHAGDVFSYCGSGERFGVNFNFAVQDKPNGIAGALRLCETWAAGDNVMVVLGDNVFEQIDIHKEIAFEAKHIHEAVIFVKDVKEPQRFGVCKFRDGPRLPGDGTRRALIGVVEKPANPPSDYAVTGCYIFPETVWGIISSLTPSGRGELEVTDVINQYIEIGLCQIEYVTGYWSDAGTMESYRAANEWAWRQK
jgi:glucose-1-phosphate thymidylyltransferase